MQSPDAALSREPDWPEGFYWNEAEGRPVYSPQREDGSGERPVNVVPLAGERRGAADLPHLLVSSDWRETWREAPDAEPLGLTLPKPEQGNVGIADFIAGTYPACSNHGAMNRVASHSQVWRCLNCNVGADFTAGGFPRV